MSDSDFREGGPRGEHDASREATDTDRPFQFRLRTLLIGVTVVAVLLAEARYVSQPFFLPLLIATLTIAFIAVKGKQWETVASVGGILALLSLLCWPEPPQEVGPRRRITCPANMKNVVLALHTYHDVYHSFPPAYIADAEGRPMHSWRVLILPYMEQGQLYEEYRFDEPWDGPNNKKLHDVIVPYYSCPSQNDPGTSTNYLAVVGPGTAWPGTESVSFGDMKDGPENTIVLVEVADSGIHWMEPRDLHLVQMARGINPAQGQGISSHHPGLAMAGFGDGAVRSLSNDELTPQLLEALLTIAGGEEVQAP